jgi:predicted lipoprotein with Yx(FWY)xxD motif
MKRLLVIASMCLTVGAASLVLACGGGDEAKTVKLGDQTFNDKGTKDAAGAATLEVEADSYYFEPTFIRGTAGQKIKLDLTNDSSAIHNLSVPALLIDQDIAAKGKAQVEVTLPQSGVLLFLCKYHTTQGMNGELLVGDAQPQAASAATAAPTVKVRDAGALGKILTDSSGRTVYLFKNDVPGSGKSAVSGNTLATWPPLVVTGSPLKTPDVSGDLTVITRHEGGQQVTYKGNPLYYFARDLAPGDTNGQGVGNNWFVVNP